MKNKYLPDIDTQAERRYFAFCPATWWASLSLFPDSIQKFCRRSFAPAKTHAPRRSAIVEEAKIARYKLMQIKPDFSLDAVLAAFSSLNPEALRPRFKMWIDGLRKAGLDMLDEPTAAG